MPYRADLTPHQQRLLAQLDVAPGFAIVPIKVGAHVRGQSPKRFKEKAKRDGALVKMSPGREGVRVDYLREVQS